MSEIETNEPEGDEEEFVALTQDYVRTKIKHVLTLYPKISPSMLQIGIGTGVPPRFWRPIFAQMIKEGAIEVKTFNARFPSGRDHVYKVVSLKQAA